MRVMHQFISPPDPCPYLPDRISQLEYLFVGELSGAEYEEMMNCGCRKFGVAVFRPACNTCRECRPIRVDAGQFRPDRGQRRAWKRNRTLRVATGPPQADAARLALYRRYHAAQTLRKGWPEQHGSEDDYSATFVANPVPNAELSLWDGEQLRAVVLVDITPQALSAIYHYYEPDLARLGLGTAAILHTIELARQSGKKWVYLGFYVAGSRGMEYKARFRPCEILDVKGGWRAQP